jgi:putative nucleotidyltransferase with HDIG domain
LWQHVRAQLNTRRPRVELERSLTLLRVFLGASALLLVAAAVVLGWLLTATLRSQAITDQRTSLSRYVDGVLGPQLVHDNRLVVTKAVKHDLLLELGRDHEVMSVKVWRSDGVLAWASLAPQRIGKRFAPDDELEAALEQNRTVAKLGSLDPADTESDAERSLGFGQMLQVYAPLRGRGGRPIGAYEIYADPAQLESLVASRKHVLWAVVAAVFAVLYALLALLVRSASVTLRRRTAALRARSRELAESYSLLERSTLEAIESLNATVDAKDPYTAGHSLRVQQVALAIAAELDLDTAALDDLRHGALFHDIGKLAVPDAVLTKPGALDDDEWEQIKLHCEAGARIVEKLGRLRGAVPIIRWHHERYDGGGYPDGLAADEIPVAAAITALADSWDAMISERPYRRGLPLAEAIAEVRRCRGTQFAPAVVDAFLAAVRNGSLATSGDAELRRAS